MLIRMDSRYAAAYGRAIAQQLRAEIAAAGFTVTTVAARTGIPRISIDRWVKGTRLVTVANLYRICAAIDLDPRLLIERATLRHHDTHTVTPTRRTERSLTA